MFILLILSNAVKYNRAGGAVEVTVIVVNKDYVRINVSDTGHGIDMARTSELFEPFNRLDREHEEVEGTGIGLGISKKLVEMMGGTLGVESEIDKGSCFWVELPLAEMVSEKSQNH